MSTDLQAAIDARLNDALTASNYRITLNTQKQNARLKLQRELTYSTNGGIFSITPELISFVAALLMSQKTDAVFLDNNSNPIEIADLKNFHEELVNRYYEAMNEFLMEVKQLQKARTTKAVVGES
jgi:hypothetical protein